MALKHFAPVAITVFLLGCGMDGPAPADKGNEQAASKSSTATAPPPPSTNRNASSATPPKPPGWSPDPDVLDKLQNYAVEPVSHTYRLRPPKGWKFNSVNEGSGPPSMGNSGHWTEPAFDEQHAQCELVLNVWKYKNKTSASSAKFDDIFDALFKKTFDAEKEGLPETGQSGGITFTRYRWIGAAAGAVTRGVTYFAHDDNRVLMVSAISFTGDYNAAMRLAENSALTLTEESAAKEPLTSASAEATKQSETPAETSSGVSAPTSRSQRAPGRLIPACKPSYRRSLWIPFIRSIGCDNQTAGPFIPIPAQTSRRGR